jgi:hypothetical protein
MYHSLLWYRNDFNTAIKYDYVINNMAESFNNWIKTSRSFLCVILLTKYGRRSWSYFIVGAGLVGYLKAKSYHLFYGY